MWTESFMPQMFYRSKQPCISVSTEQAVLESNTVTLLIYIRNVIIMDKITERKIYNSSNKPLKRLLSGKWYKYTLQDELSFDPKAIITLKFILYNTVQLQMHALYDLLIHLLILVSICISKSYIYIYLEFCLRECT